MGILIESVKYAKYESACSNVAPLKPGRKDSIELYVAHVHEGRSLRSLARETGLNPSTVLRRVRKVEDRRDDPLIDDLLDSALTGARNLCQAQRDDHTMANAIRKDQTADVQHQEQMRVLRRLCETGAFLAVGADLPKGAVFRAKDGEAPTRIAVVDREVAKSLALRDCIKLTKNDTINVYHITEVGRAVVRRDLSGEEPFGNQHREMGHKTLIGDGGSETRQLRVNLRESPLTMLARKRDAKGKPFISKELLEAGERLREDFELSQMGPSVTQNWDRFLNGGDRGAFTDSTHEGSSAAQLRLNNALSALGSGLGDIALRCCCFLEGLEAAEKRMGWSARSGKIVLRIALQRLRLYYDELGQQGGDYIG